jgi:hypothetical protein
VVDGTTFLLVYGLGVAVGIARTDAPPAARLGLALLWPVGPAAFIATLGLLAVASLIAFPTIGALVVAAGLIWFAFG